MNTFYPTFWLVCCVTSQKVRKKVFNWSEVHLYRSNFLQNPYFNLQGTFGRISSHFLYFLFQIRRGCSVRNFRQTTRGMRNFQLLIDGATFLLMLLFSNNFKWNHNYRSMQFAKYTNYFMGKLASNLLWQYFHSICIAFSKCFKCLLSLMPCFLPASFAVRHSRTLLGFWTYGC